MFALALILGLIAAGTVYWYISGLKNEISNRENTEVIVVARDQIPRNIIIRREMLQEKEVVLGTKIPGAYNDLEQVAGKVAIIPIYKGQQPVDHQLAEIGKGDKGLSYVIAEGKRAITVAVDEVAAVAGYVLPGDLVDIVVTLNVSKNGEEVVFNTFVVEKVRLLALGIEGVDSGRTEAAEKFNSATLEVNAEIAPKLALAADSGRIRLVLRSPLDEGYSSLSSFELKQFLPQEPKQQVLPE